MSHVYISQPPVTGRSTSQHSDPSFFHLPFVVLAWVSHFKQFCGRLASGPSPLKQAFTLAINMFKQINSIYIKQADFSHSYCSRETMPSTFTSCRFIGVIFSL